MMVFHNKKIEIHFYDFELVHWAVYSMGKAYYYFFYFFYKIHMHLLVSEHCILALVHPRIAELLLVILSLL